MKISVYKKGVGLVEVVVAVGILAIVFSSVTVAFKMSVKTGLSNSKNIKAAYLAQEGIEAVKFWRDSSWTNEIVALSLNTPYHLNFSTTTSKWSATTTASVIDDLYTRSITFTEVLRDGNNDIASTGSADSNTRLVTVTVEWQNGEATSTASLHTYLHNIHDN